MSGSEATTMWSSAGFWLAVLATAVPLPRALADVALELRPASQTVFAGQTLEVELFAVANPDLPVGIIAAIVQWDPAALTLLGNETTGAADWSQSEFPSTHPLNQDLSDGLALYDARIDAKTCIPVVATAGGTLVTTLRFRAVAASDPASTFVAVLADGGGYDTQVWDGLDAGNCVGSQYATVPLGLPAGVLLIPCTLGTDCVDGVECTLDECSEDGVCSNPSAPAGERCGNPNPIFSCDLADACDGMGSCLPNPTPPGQPCSDDGNPCTDDVCDGAGLCDHPALADGTGCSDGLFCTGEETCLGGVCESGPMPCNTPGLLCSEMDGDCDCENDEACDDGLICTGKEFCDPATMRCVSPGDPCPGSCSEKTGCGCEAPTVTPAGPRYIGIAPQGVTSDQPMTLRVESPDFPCLSKYVGFLSCGESGSPCRSDAECNSCTFTDAPCLTNADCSTCSGEPATSCANDGDCASGDSCVSVESCTLSGDSCVARDQPVPVDIDGDGIFDGSLAGLVDDPFDAMSLSPAEWVGLADSHCGISKNVCTDDSDCDIGLCIIVGDTVCAGTQVDCVDESECEPGVPCVEVLAFAPIPCSVSAQNCADGLPCVRGMICNGSDNSGGPCTTNADCQGVVGLGTCERVGETCVKPLVFVTGEDVVPSARIDGVFEPTRYSVQADCGTLTAATPVTMPIWADVNNNGIVNVSDIQFTLFAAVGRFDPGRGLTLVSTDISAVRGPCFTNQATNANDLFRVLRAFQQEGYVEAVNKTSAATGCSLPCR